MLYLKTHDTEKGTIVALCDEELLGKIYKEAKIELDLDKYSEFYKGELKSEDESRVMLKNTEIFSANVVGKRSIKVFQDLSLIEEGTVKTVQGVPFAQIFKLDM